MRVATTLHIAAVLAALAVPAAAQPAFVIESANGDNRLQLGVLAHFDGRFTVDDPRQDVTDTFVARRVRPIFQGRVARYFDYFVVLDLAVPNVVRDAYFETRVAEAFRVRVGKGKVPFGHERLHFVNGLLFVERALPSGLTPDRDVGVSDGASADTDADEGKELSGRFIVRPWAANIAHPLSGLGVVIAGTTGTQAGPLPVYRSAGQQVFYSHAAATGDGRRHRMSPQAFFYRGPFGGFAEYIRSSGDVRRGTAAGEIENSGWEVSASWVLTGETATDRGVRPRSNFDPPGHHYGALQIAARYHRLTVDQDAFSLGFAAPGSSRAAEAFTLGVNWYLNPFVKWALNVERTVFDGDADGPRPAENAILLRGQLSF